VESPCGIDDRSLAVNVKPVDVCSRVATGASLWSGGHTECPLLERRIQQSCQQQKLIDKCISGSESRSDVHQGSSSTRDASPFGGSEIQSARCCTNPRFSGRQLPVESHGAVRNHSSSTPCPTAGLAKRRLIDQRRRRSPLSLATQARITMIRLNGN
jgi:hypothetical protein